MIQARIISGTIERSGSKPVTVHDHPLQTQDPNLLPGYAQIGIEIDPKNENDGYGESRIDIDALFPSTELEMFKKNEHEGLCITQKDGSGDGDDAEIKPNTNAPYDEDDEELNENDDDVEEGGGIDDDDIQHLIVCQFDHVKKKKKKTRSIGSANSKLELCTSPANNFFSQRLKEISNSKRSLI